MARNRTIGDVLSEIRDRGEVPTNYVSNAELYGWINGSIAELYDLLVSVNKDMYVSQNSINTVSGNSNYDLPSDFYRIVGIDIQETDGDYYPMRRYNFSERNMYQDGGQGKRWTRYRVYNSQMWLSPPPNYVAAVRRWYIPAAPAYATDGTNAATNFDFFGGWDEYVITDCLIKFAGKEESDATLFAAQKGALIKRIKSMAADLDDGEPDRIRDVQLETAGDYWPSYFRP